MVILVRYRRSSKSGTSSNSIAGVQNCSLGTVVGGLPADDSMYSSNSISYHSIIVSFNRW